ncbi:MAG: alanyl-tRNA editing protein [Methanobacteriota archaeon]
MTEILFMRDADANYVREFEATVVSKGENFVVLDRTAFYAVGGGQETDTGSLSWEGGSASVKEVTKKGEVRHRLDGPVPDAGTIVHGEIDWERRHAHMRMHTAQHIISSVVFDIYKARTVGNQIHADRSRVDFAPANFTQDDVQKIEAKCNEIAAKGIGVRIYEEDRTELEKRVDQQRANLDLLPQSIRRLRIVDIDGFDVCPCAGTHVRNTNEIGRFHILEREKKGKGRERLTYELLA